MNFHMSSYLIAEITLVGMGLDLLGGFYLAYDLLGGSRGPLRAIARTIGYIALFFLGYIALLGLAYALIGSVGMGISLVAMGVMAQSLTNPTVAAGWMLFFILLYVGCFGLSVGPVTWVILAEIFPTAVRGRALGVAAFCLWTADYAVTQTFPVMDANTSWFVAHFNHAFPFYTYAAFCVVLALVVWRLVPETKGRSLEEIEQSWS